MNSESKAASTASFQSVTVVAQNSEHAAGQEHTPDMRLPGHRGRQKRPTKILVTMRFSPEILAYFKASGEGWQTRMNDVLLDYVIRNDSRSKLRQEAGELEQS